METNTNSVNQTLFDYEKVSGSISKITAALDSINAAIEDKVVNTTYEDGNAKEAVESYISSVNSCFDPIVPDIEKMRKDLQEVNDTYLAAETGITSGLGGGAGTSTGHAAAGGREFSTTHRTY